MALVSGGDRAQNVLAALRAIDDQIRPILQAKKSILIKPNVVIATRGSACTHADVLRGVLEYIAQSGFRGPAVIAEAGWCYTIDGFNNYGYPAVINEYRRSSAFTSLDLIDLNEEGLYVVQQVLDSNLHVQPIRAAARLFDPDAFIVSTALMKTHDRVVATMSVKNMAMGSPLHATRAEGWQSWSDKPKMHENYRLANVNIHQMARELKRYWGLAVIDGLEGMEGNGPTSGTGVASGVAIASTDFVAADRVAVECMGINPDWIRVSQLRRKARAGPIRPHQDQRNRGPGSGGCGAHVPAARSDQRRVEWQQPFPSCVGAGGRLPRVSRQIR